MSSLLRSLVFVIAVGSTVLAQEPAPAGEEAGRTRVEGRTMIFDSGERLDLERSEIVVEGQICLKQGPIELFACAPGGKDHESVVVLRCKPQNLHLALISLGLRDRAELGGVGPKYLGDPTPPAGDLIVVEVEYELDGKVVRHRAEDLIVNVRQGRSMARAGWVFAGSSFAAEEDPETGKPTGRRIYLANRYRSIVTTYHDPTALVDNPTREGGNDDMFVANGELLPAPGTRAKVYFRLPTPEERKEMQAVAAQVEAEAERETEEEKRG